MQPTTILHHAQMQKTGDTSGAVKTTLVQEPTKGMGLLIRQNEGSELLAIHYLFKHKVAYEDQYGEDAAKILHDCFGQRMKSDEKMALSQQYGLKFTVNDNPWIPMDNIYLHSDFGYIRVEGLANDVNGAISFLNSEMNGFLPTMEEFNAAQGKFSKSMMHGGKDKAKDLFNNLVDSALYSETPSVEKKKLTYAGLMAFGSEYFVPNNRIVSVVSPVSAEKLSPLLLVPSSNKPSRAFPFTEKPYMKREAPTTIEMEGGGERSYLFWGFSKTIESGDEAAVKALGLILSDKIIFDVREKQGMAYRMTATAALRDNQALFHISLGTRPQNADVLVPQFPDLMNKKIIAGITQDDVQKTINMYLGRMMFRRLSSINQAYYLSNSLFFEGDMNHDQAFLDALKRVTLEDVNRVADKYLVAENTVSIVVR